MSHPISADLARTLVQEILNGRHDLPALAQAHGLHPDELAAWMIQAQNHQTLAGLCTLADFQSQLRLSRFRSVAATHLYRLMGAEKEPDQQTQEEKEMSRKVCVDLLKANLPRTAPAGIAPGAEEVDAGSLATLRQDFYKHGVLPAEPE